MRLIERGWTEIEEDPRWEDEEYYERTKPILDLLAKEWSIIYYSEEQKRFAMDPYQEYGYDWEPEEYEYWQEQKRIENAGVVACMEYIENRLKELGARMMRPYEHWNEDEAYMAYMERDR